MALAERALCEFLRLEKTVSWDFLDHVLSLRQEATGMVYSSEVSTLTGGMTPRSMKQESFMGAAVAFLGKRTSHVLCGQRVRP